MKLKTEVENESLEDVRTKKQTVSRAIDAVERRVSVDDARGRADEIRGEWHAEVVIDQRECERKHAG